MKKTILSYHQEDSIKLLCEIDLKKLLPEPKQRERFNKKWGTFFGSDSYNKEIFELKGDRLKYQSGDFRDVHNQVNNFLKAFYQLKFRVHLI